jgi:L-ascorbate metabolism protein UlaG (beta-lactamase superfamily)
MGHATTLIQTPTLNIITDPILFDSIGPRLAPIKTVTNPPVTVGRLPRIDIILISHNHYDHLDLRSLHAIFNHQARDPPTVLVGLGVGALLKKEGISPYSELDWNDSVTIKDTRIVFLEAVHTSRRGLWDTNRTLWGSFLIDSPEGRIYFAGDTAYGKHFKDIYERFGPPQISLLPIGAYEPRWFMYRMHMNPDDAVLAHIDLHSQHSIAIHFGLIDNASESYEAPVHDLAIARRTHGIEKAAFVAPHLGQVFEFDGCAEPSSRALARPPPAGSQSGNCALIQSHFSGEFFGNKIHKHLRSLRQQPPLGIDHLDRSRRSGMVLEEQLHPSVEERIFKQPHRRVGNSESIQGCSAYPIRSVDSEATVHGDIPILE